MSLKYAKFLRVNHEKIEEKEEKKEKPIKKINTLLCSTDRFPLGKWKKFVKNGYVKRVNDLEIDGKVLELSGPSNTVWISTPKDRDRSIGTTYHWLFFIIKAVPEKQLIIEVQVLDSNNIRRTFKFDTKTTLTKVRYMVATLDLNVRPGFWNCLEMDLLSLLNKNFGTRFSELCRIQVHGTCKIRRIFSASSYVSQEELPIEYRLSAATVSPQPTANKQINT